MTETILETYDNRTDSDVAVAYDPDAVEEDGFNYIVNVDGTDTWATDEDDWGEVMESFGGTRVGGSNIKPQVIEIREGLFSAEVSRVVAGDIMRAIEDHEELRAEMIDVLDSWFEHTVYEDWGGHDFHVAMESYESGKLDALTDHYDNVTVADTDGLSASGALVYFEIND